MRKKVLCKPICLMYPWQLTLIPVSMRHEIQKLMFYVQTTVSNLTFLATSTQLPFSHEATASSSLLSSSLVHSPRFLSGSRVCCQRTLRQQITHHQC